MHGGESLVYNIANERESLERGQLVSEKIAIYICSGDQMQISSGTIFST